MFRLTCSKFVSNAKTSQKLLLGIASAHRSGDPTALVGTAFSMFPTAYIPASPLGRRSACDVAHGTVEPNAATRYGGHLLWRLRTMDTCALCDASAKQARVVSTVHPLRQGYRMVGRVRTVQIDGDFLEILAAIHDAEPGDVLMIDASMRGEAEDAEWPRAGGHFGELLAHEAERKGVAGMVIDGNCRDTPLTQHMGLPIYSRGRNPNAGTAWKRGRTQRDVLMGGVLVKPGEYVLGDDDGVVVCSEKELMQWLPKAEAIQKTEAGMLAHIQSGGSLFDKVPNFKQHLEAVSAGDTSSRLHFD